MGHTREDVEFFAKVLAIRKLRLRRQLSEVQRKERSGDAIEEGEQGDQLGP